LDATFEDWAADQLERFACEVAGWGGEDPAGLADDGSASPPGPRGVVVEPWAGRRATPDLSNGGSVYTEVSCDWLRVVVYGVALDLVVQKFGGGVLVEGLHRYWYDIVHKLGIGGWVLAHSSRSEMGVCVDLGGQALEGLRLLWNVESDAELIRMIERWAGGSGGHVSCARFDGALDDVKDILDMGEIRRSVRAGEFTSDCHRETVRDRSEGGFSPNGEWSEAGIVTFGKRDSERYGRIYDKRAQLIMKGVPGGELPAHWVRVELELKGAQAEAAWEYACQHVSLSDWLPAAVRGFLEFREPSESDSNERRWAVRAWWLQACGLVRDKLHVVRDIALVSVERRWRAYERQWAPTVAVLLTMPGGEKRLERVHERAAGRAQAELVAAVRAASLAAAVRVASLAALGSGG